MMKVSMEERTCQIEHPRQYTVTVIRGISEPTKSRRDVQKCAFMEHSREFRTWAMSPTTRL